MFEPRNDIRTDPCPVRWWALALVLFFSFAISARAEVQLELAPLEEGLRIQIGEEWPDGCLPTLDRVEVELTDVEVYLESPTGACAGEAARPWNLTLRLAPVTVRRPGREEVFQVKVLWRPRGTVEWSVLADGQSVQAPDCLEPPGRICLLNRFEAKVSFRAENGDWVLATSFPIGPSSGGFWFYNRANPEVILKVIDACSTFDSIWVFAAGLTDRETLVEVWDRRTREKWGYHSPADAGFQPVRDTQALPCRVTTPSLPWSVELGTHDLLRIKPGPEGSVTVELEGEWDWCQPWIGNIDVDEGVITLELRVLGTCKGSNHPSSKTLWTSRARIDGLEPGEYAVEVRLRNQYDNLNRLYAKRQVRLDWDRDDATCNRAEVFCTPDQRFAIRAWYDTGDGEVPASGYGLTPKSAGFWFFRPDNLELMVKVLDGCSAFDRFWVFATGLTNVGVRLEVVDRWTGERWERKTAPGEGFPDIRDTAAFASCGAVAPEAN